MKPIIGITSSLTMKKEPFLSVDEEQKVNQLSDTCIKAVENAGGIPIIIPLLADIENVKILLEGLNGVLLSGGGDISPNEYNQQPSDTLKSVNPFRDRQEIEIVNHIINYNNKPLLGICRGMQIINVALGGDLYQDLESEGFRRHLLNKNPRNYKTHNVNLHEKSFLSEIFNKNKIGVNSFHHQAVKNLGRYLKAIAFSEDNVIEAVEYIDEYRFILGVQWHPEEMFDEEGQQNIFRKFIDFCK